MTVYPSRVLNALVSGELPQSWVQELLASLDVSTRATLLRSTSDSRQLLLQAEGKATLTLRAHGGLSAVAWQSRLRQAERDLVARGQPRRTKLVLQLATPNAAAVQALLGSSVGGHITELAVRQGLKQAYNATDLPVPWLHQLPHSFPNITTLHLEYIYNPLPPPDQLPHVKEISIVTCITKVRGVNGPTAAELASGPVGQLCASVGAYITRTTHLSITDEVQAPYTPLPWSLIFPAPTTTLHTLHTNLLLGNTLMQQLRVNVPELKHLTCMGPHWGSEWAPGGNDQLSDEHVQAAWAVQDMQCLARRVEAAALARLPRSAQGLRLKPASGRHGLSMDFHVVDAQVS